MAGDEGGFGGLDEPINLHVCITKIMKPLIVIVPLLVMFTIIYIKVAIFCYFLTCYFMLCYFIQKDIPEYYESLERNVTISDRNETNSLF